MSNHWKVNANRAPDMPVRRCAMDQMIPGNSPRMQDLKQLVELVAPNDSPALILGETGTGKELVAQALHKMSGRRGAFVAINCAAIPAELLEGELFGHEKGAFTGADRSRAGLFEAAQGGTLFLDEIGDMPLAMQAKLLRVLETRQVRRLGGHAMIDVDFRLVAATHRGLPAMVQQGSFRQDLYFRLAVFPLVVPSLAERPGDMPLILDRLLAEICPADRAALRPTFDTSALRALAAHDWPGNIRELRAVVCRAVALFPGRTVTAQTLEHNLLTFTAPGSETPSLSLAEDTASDADIGPFDRALVGCGGLDLRIHIRDIEIAAIEAALRRSRGCVSSAADLLHLRRTTLIEKMKKYGIHAKI